MKIVTLNIGNPSLKRAERQIKWISNINSDVIVLTEFKLSDGGKLIENYFLKKGYKTFKMLENSQKYGVLIITKDKKFILEKKLDISELNERAILIKNKKISILGIYVPPNGKDKLIRKKPFLEEIFRIIVKEKPSIICGDFNTVSREHNPVYKTFRAWEYNFMNEIQKIYKDNSEVDSYSWYGKTGNPYKYDYIFIKKDLNKIIKIKYIENTVNLKLTDHYAVMGEFENENYI